jgi:hypothetical protein
VRARERVGPTAGKADDREPLDPERLRELADVVRELDDRTVGVRRRGPDPRPLDRDQTNVAVPALASRLWCDLPARAGGSVEPEDGAPLGRAELGIAEFSTVAQAEGALEARRTECDHLQRPREPPSISAHECPAEVARSGCRTITFASRVGFLVQVKISHYRPCAGNCAPSRWRIARHNP